MNRDLMSVAEVREYLREYPECKVFVEVEFADTTMVLEVADRDEVESQSWFFGNEAMLVVTVDDGELVLHSTGTEV